MRDQEQGMEKVSGGGRRRRKGGLSIPMNGGCGVGVAILVFAAAAAAVGASVVARARRARREDRTTKRSFAEDVDNERIEGVKEEEEEEVEEENYASIISQRRGEMGEETEEISFQIDQENQSIGKLDLSPRREDTEIVAATEEEEEIILKAGNDGDYDRESSEGSKATPTEVKVSEEANDESEGDEKEEEEDSTEDEKEKCDPSSVEFEATTEPSTEETVDGSNDDSGACLTESGVFEAAAEAIENASKTEENDFSAKKREVEWKLEDDDVSKVPRGEPKKIEIRNTARTIAIEENGIGFSIANRSKRGLLMISAFVLAIVLLLFVRRDRPGVLELSTM